MSYKIEVNADSISELAGKLLALAAQMQAVPVDPVMPEVKAAEVKTEKPKKAKAVKEEVGNEQPASTAEDPSQTSNSEPDTKTVEAAQSRSEPEAPAEAAALDFEKDVAPIVLNAVRVKGKPWVQEILGQFGVERASQVPDAQFGELVALLNDGVA